MIQSGQSDTACKDMEHTLIKSAEPKAEDIAKMCQALDNGAKCPNAGQVAVQEAQKRKEVTGKNVKERELKLLDAQEALRKVNIAKDKAAAEDQASDETLATAKQTAVVEVKTCQCKAKAAYKTATAAANENAIDDAAAYTKGKHMLCVLEGTTDLSKCDVGTVPKPVGITLASNTASAECNKNEPVAQFAKGSAGDAACPAGYERIAASDTSSQQYITAKQSCLDAYKALYKAAKYVKYAEYDNIAEAASDELPVSCFASEIRSRDDVPPASHSRLFLNRPHVGITTGIVLDSQFQLQFGQPGNVHTLCKA